MRKILSGVGLILHVPAFMALLSVVISVLFNEAFGTKAFLLTGMVSLVIGQSLYRIFSYDYENEKQDSVFDIMILATIGWLATEVTTGTKEVMKTIMPIPPIHC